MLAGTGEPTAAEQGQALVDGFHIAYVGSALFVATGAVLLALLLRREDARAVAVGGEPAVAET
jgi:hypothetical protein